jgi:hypothetical protein
MALTITHAQVAGTGVDTDAIVDGADWDANHTIAGSIAASEVTSGAALTKVDDTNVTLTLGGAPTTALLTATSVTVGWTGTLAASRGGTGISSLGTGVATALGVNVGSAGAFVTFDGALGTPSSGTLTNATGLPVASGISGFGTGIATALAVNTGSAGAPVLFNGALGTPSSGTLTNCSIPISQVTSLGAGVNTFLQTPSSANLRSALTDEEGAGAAYFVGGALGSPSSVGTLPAFTLGGTISGGGNQVNNVIIGTSTPLAGAFTTLTASTSVTSPLHYGGSAAGSTMLLNGTSSGSPSSAFLNLQSNGQFASVGNTSPKTYLDINANLTSSPSLVVATSVVRMQAPDSVSGGQEWVSYAGAGAGNILSGAVANGTSVSPTATANGSYMFNLRGYGYTGSAFAVGSIIIMRSDSLWSGTNQGSAIDFYTTPNTTTSIALAATLQASGGLSVGTSVDPGIGGIIANTSLKSRGATAGMGYAAGAGGTVTQITSRTTGVTLNKVCGGITLFAAAPAVGTWVSFTVTNSAVEATDVPHVSVKSGTNTYIAHVTAVAAGSFQISFTSIVGTASDSPVINFAVLKAVAA